VIKTTLAQANRFVLQKNFLADTRAADTGELCRQLAGLPAEPQLTPFLAAFVRLDDFLPARLIQPNTLIPGLLLRSTRYLLPLDIFPTWFAATVRQRNQFFNAEFRRWGIESNEIIEQLGAEILRVLGDDSATAAEISGRLPGTRQLTQTSRGGRVSTTTDAELALRWLVGSGQLVELAAGLPLQPAEPQFARLPAQYPAINLTDLSGEAEAQRAVVRAYLAAFGPATQADISFWTGFGKSETARATGALAAETVLTLVPGIPGMLLLLKEQAEALQGIPPNPTEPLVNVLPADDPYLTAHRASRSRYFADQSLQRQVFRSSGAAKPSVLVDGQVVGTWQITETGGVDWQPLADVDRALQPAIETELARVGGFVAGLK
jgi:hypothetical protein